MHTIHNAHNTYISRSKYITTQNRKVISAIHTFTYSKRTVLFDKVSTYSSKLPLRGSLGGPKHFIGLLLLEA